MKTWHFQNSAPWRGVFDFVNVDAADFRNWSHELGQWKGPGYPYNTGEATGGYWSTIQAGGGEGGSVDAQQWTPITFTETAAMPALFRGFLKGWVSPDDAHPILMPGEVRQPIATEYLTASAVPVWDLSRLPDKGKYVLGFVAISSDSMREQLYYPDLLRNDPNYGTITYAVNVKHPAELADKVFMVWQVVITTAISAGFGALEFPAWAMATVKDASTGSVQGFLKTGLGAAMDIGDFNVGDILDDTELPAIDLGTVQNDPGFLGGGVDPASGDWSQEDIDAYFAQENQGGPGDGVIDDNPAPTDNNSNPYNPDQQPGMPNAPTPPRKSGVNTPGARPPSSGVPSGGTSGGDLGSIFQTIFGSNKNHAAPGYAAGPGSLPNAKPIVGQRPIGSGATPAALASMFASPAFIAIIVAGGLAIAMAGK